MSTLTLNIPELKHQKLKQLAQSRGISLDALLDEMTTLMLQELAMKQQFEIRAKRGHGKAQRGLDLLKKAQQAKPEN